MGPVYICLPADVWDARNEEPVYPSCILNLSACPDEQTLEQAADLLCAAKEPTIFIGDGIAYAKAQKEVEMLADYLGAFVWGWESKSAFLVDLAVD